MVDMTWLREMFELFRMAWRIEKEWRETKRAIRARMKEMRRRG